MTLEVMFIFKEGNSWRTKKDYLTEPTNDPKNPFKLSYKQAAKGVLHVNEPVRFKQFFYQFQNEEAREDLKTKDYYKVQLADAYIKEKDVTKKKVKEASQAVLPCFDFIVGMIDFCEKAINIVDPIRKKAAIAKEKKILADTALAEAQTKLNKAQKECDE